MNNVALITGASSGIGKELAIIHASKKRDLVLVARRTEELEALKTELIQKYGVEVLVLPSDLMQIGAAKKVFDAVKEQNIEIEYLINNAGLGGYGKFYQRDRNKEVDMIQLNIVALTELTHLILPEMVARKSGKILNTASTAGFIPGPMQSVYFATKAFVVSFSQGIAQEVSTNGISVTALCPGPVRTEFEKEAGMEGSGLFKKAATAISTAQKGYSGMEKGKLIVITDNSLRFALNWLLPFAPRKMVMRAIEKMQTIK
jgi:short-subunit dehydrogenase